MNELESQLSNKLPRVLCFVTLTIDMFLLGLILWQTTVFRQSFQGFFSDFGVELPYFTAMLLSVPGKVYVVAVACLSMILMAKEITISDTSSKLIINLSVGVALLIFAVLFHFALLMPWMSLIQNLR
jgi:hypothetical protein